MRRSLGTRSSSSSATRGEPNRHVNARPGLGDDFISAVDEALERARANPSAYRVMLLDMRRVLVKRFPYAIYFVEEDDSILVIALFHGHQDTERLSQRR